MFHNSFYRFPPVNKNEKINTQLLFATININMVIEPWIFYLFAGKSFPQSSVNYNDVNLEKKLKIECRDQFSIFVFGRRINRSRSKYQEGRTQVQEWGWGGGVEGRRDCNCPPSSMSDTSWELALGKKQEIQLWSAVSA